MIIEIFLIISSTTKLKYLYRTKLLGQIEMNGSSYIKLMESYEDNRWICIFPNSKGLVEPSDWILFNHIIFPMKAYNNSNIW